MIKNDSWLENIVGSNNMNKPQKKVKARRYTTMTESERQAFAEDYPHTTNAELCKKYNIGHRGCWILSKQLGVEKSAEFMHQQQIENFKLANKKNRQNNYEIQRKNAPKNNNGHRFKKGEYVLANRGEEFLKEFHKRCGEARKKTFRKEQTRVALGLPQKTKMRVIKWSHKKICHAYLLRKRGYTQQSKCSAYFIITNDTQRNARAEKTAIEKYNFRFIDKTIDNI